VTRNPVLGAVLLPVELAAIAGMRSFGLRTRAQEISRHHREEIVETIAGHDESDTAEGSGAAGELRGKAVDPGA